MVTDHTQHGQDRTVDQTNGTANDVGTMPTVGR